MTATELWPLACGVDAQNGRSGQVIAVLPCMPGVLLVRSGESTCELLAVPFDDVDPFAVDRMRALRVPNSSCVSSVGQAPSTASRSKTPGT
jgi:hypothetical protein